MANAWIEFVKKWSKDNKVGYSEALKSPKLRAAYNKSKGKGAVKGKGGKGKMPKDEDPLDEKPTRKAGRKKSKK